MVSHKEQKEKINLAAEDRTLLGKRVRSMRKAGKLPANVYGKGFDSKSISIDTKAFIQAYKHAGATNVVYIEVAGETIPTLITDVTYHPLTQSILHIDFRKVNLKQKVQANVPLTFVGESEAVKTLNGVLNTQMDEIIVEALPTHIPSEIEVDITALSEIGAVITVADLPTTAEYIIIDDAEKIVVSVIEHVEQSLEPETASDAPEITEGTGEEPGAEGEAADPEAPATEEKSE
ncbi:MAG: 50S ribosomal protein L25 [Weeksellaceae bacterium]